MDQATLQQCSYPLHAILISTCVHVHVHTIHIHVLVPFTLMVNLSRCYITCTICLKQNKIPKNSHVYQVTNTCGIVLQRPMTLEYIDTNVISDKYVNQGW